MQKIRRPQKPKVRDFSGKIIVDGNFERALRQFKKKTRKSGVIQECRKRSQFIKPSEQRRESKKKAILREARRCGDVSGKHI